MSKSTTPKIIFTGLFFSLMAIYVSCSKDDNSNEEPNPDPVANYTRSFPTGRTGERVIDYVGKQELGRATTNSQKIATYSFTKAKYDELDEARSSRAGKGASAQIVIDSTIVKDGDVVVSRTGQQTITSNTSSLNIANERFLYSHEFQWYGNASPANFELWANGAEDPAATAVSVDYSPLPTRVNLTWLDDKNIARVDSIRGTFSLAGVPFLDVFQEGPINVEEFLDYTGGPGPQGDYIFEQETSNTDVGIVPTIYGGNQVLNTTITLDNIDTPGNTYTISESGPQAIFYDIFVEGESDQYEISIESNLGGDSPFFQTIDTVVVLANQQQQFQIEVDAVQNQQNITIVTRDFENLNELVANYTIELREEGSDVLIDTKVTDGGGLTTFENVTGSRGVYVVGYGSGRYRKTSGVYSIPTVQLLNQTDTILNVTSPRFFNYSDGQQVEAEIINWYRPLADNTEAALDQLRIYFPEAPERQIAIEQLQNAASLTGTPFTVEETFVGLPTSSVIAQYNPFPGSDRQTFPGQVQTLVTSYNGGATNTSGRLLPNGRGITFYTLTWDLGGTSENLNHHEYGNLLNIPPLDGNRTIFTGEFFITSRDVNAAQIVRIDESKWDLAIMPFWVQIQKYHYNTTDSEGRLIEYSIPEAFE